MKRILDFATRTGYLSLMKQHHQNMSIPPVVRKQFKMHVTMPLKHERKSVESADTASAIFGFKRLSILEPFLPLMVHGLYHCMGY